MDATTTTTLEESIAILSDKIKAYIDSKDVTISDDLALVKSKVDQILSEETSAKISNLLTLVDSLDTTDENVMQMIADMKNIIAQNSSSIEVLATSIQENSLNDSLQDEKINSVINDIGSLATKDSVSNVAERIANAAIDASSKF